MFDFSEQNRDGSTFLIENVSDTAIQFWYSWSRADTAKKKKTIELMKRFNKDIQKSTPKLIKSLDAFLEKHYDMLTGVGRKDIVRG